MPRVKGFGERPERVRVGPMRDGAIVGIPFVIEP
jgi:hypothetical protein